MKNNKHKDDDYQIAELVIIAIDFAFKQMCHRSFYQTLWTAEFAGHLCSSVYQVLKQSTIHPCETLGATKFDLKVQVGQTRIYK